MEPKIEDWKDKAMSVICISIFIEYTVFMLVSVQSWFAAECEGTLVALIGEQVGEMFWFDVS